MTNILRTSLSLSAFKKNTDNYYPKHTNGFDQKGKNYQFASIFRFHELHLKNIHVYSGS